MKKKILPPPEGLTLDAIQSHFSTDEQAREYLESVRWEHGRYCPHCGNADEKRIYAITANVAKKVRAGLFECAECDKQFTVTVGTIFEDTKIPLRKWLVAWYLLCASKKGISALQIQRMLGLGSYRTAWFMMHRIRYALRNPSFSDKLSGTIEADETYIGGTVRGVKRGYRGNKTPVVALVERNGRARSMVIEHITGANLRQALNEHVDRKSRLMTDERPAYKGPGHRFKSHEAVNHSAGEYVRGDVHTNTVEGYFSILKRGIVGTFHHIEGPYIPQYLAEFDFRYNTRKETDGVRTRLALRKASGKRLMLRRSKAGA